VKRTVSIKSVRTTHFQDVVRGNVDNLAASIEATGLLNPIQLWETPSGLELLCGRRRLEAHRLLGRTEIQAEIHVDISTAKAAAIYWSDNDQREPLGYYAQAVAAASILGWGDADAKADKQEFLRLSGLTQPRLKRLKLLYRLLPAVGDLVDSDTLTQREGIEISRLPHGDQDAVAQEYVARISAEDRDAYKRDMPGLREMVARKLPSGDENAGPRVLADEMGIESDGSDKNSRTRENSEDTREQPCQDADNIPDDDGDAPTAASKGGKRAGTETVEYGECHDRMRLVMTQKDWIVTIKVPRDGDSRPTQDIKREFEKPGDERSAFHLLLHYIDMAAKMAVEKTGEQSK